jgi:hypothetical protein
MPILVTLSILPANTPSGPDFQRRAVWTEVNRVFIRVPMVVHAVMQTTEISAAINPYSMAVAPDSLATKALNFLIIVPSWDNAAVPTGGGSGRTGAATLPINAARSGPR